MQFKTALIEDGDDISNYGTIYGASIKSFTSTTNSNSVYWIALTNNIIKIVGMSSSSKIFRVSGIIAIIYSD